MPLQSMACLDRSTITLQVHIEQPPTHMQNLLSMCLISIVCRFVSSGYHVHLTLEQTHFEKIITPNGDPIQIQRLLI
jgi:hypothetical protein